MTTEEKQSEAKPLVTSSELFDVLFENILGAANRFNPDVVKLAKKHLAVANPQARAGQNLASDLIDLAKSRLEIKEEKS